MRVSILLAEVISIQTKLQKRPRCKSINSKTVTSNDEFAFMLYRQVAGPKNPEK